MNGNESNSVVLFFIDGLGIGNRDEQNPLFDDSADLAPLAHFRNERSAVPFGGIMVPTDPRLGVEGRPQSASGQTTILTGVNAPKVVGYHKQGFPNQQMRDIIAEHSIFRQLDALGIGPNIFANTYTPQFFSAPPRWRSATTCAVEASAVRFNRLPDLIGGHSLFHDFTNASLIERGFDVPLFSPRDAAEILARLSRKNRFVLYEHFITDKIGHDRDRERANLHLPVLAEFIRETLALIDMERTTFILTSDHGNIEDLSVRNHTLNDVPTIIWGRCAENAAKNVRDLADITPAIIGLLKG
jgi:phosphopentomutase